ncbi:hypothetical protein G7047_16225 [Diaphorobacter sp. HDW4A]|uniref:hypothetical protein n=1 Tax=Diaphorobacter sp. HDW4A TaxID=2714924 RepID=UPI00140C29F6|nr:hypothetical protein [Diaphorobacter sp. HDW4A]QIL81285.1 hypothetical protein G7047_16225 [Diaphorobacter sp. HDW4A]
MSTSLPSAEPSHPTVHRILHIAFWGIDAQTTAAAFEIHTQAQPGWTKRLQITAHDLPQALDANAIPNWLAVKLDTSPRPHLSLLVPSNPAQHTIASELHLRSALIQAGVSFQVLYGAAMAEQVRNTANALALTAKAILPSSERACFVVNDTTKPINPRMRSWNCEKCSDPECEHKLFAGLLPA